jgi:hypothetical protein
MMWPERGAVLAGRWGALEQELTPDAHRDVVRAPFLKIDLIMWLVVAARILIP